MNSAKVVTKAQQRHHKLLVSISHCSMETILIYSLCVWFSSCTVAQKKALQGVIKSAQNIPSCPLPSIQFHTSRCLREEQNVLQDSSHPSSNLSKSLPSGRRYRSLKARTNFLHLIVHVTVMIKDILFYQPKSLFSTGVQCSLLAEHTADVVQHWSRILLHRKTYE